MSGSFRNWPAAEAFRSLRQEIMRIAAVSVVLALGCGRGAAVRIGRIESSCECLTVDLGQSAVEPGERVLAEFRYDGSKEPDFVGSLMIEVEVWDDADARVGTFDVSVEVIADRNAE